MSLGGARKVQKIVATSISNPDDVRSFASMNVASRAFEFKSHYALKNAITRGTVVNGYRLEYDVTTEDQHQTQTEVPNNVRVYTFFEEVDELFKGQKVRYTADVPVRVSVYDVIRIVTGTTNPHIVCARVRETHREVLTNTVNFKFDGLGQRDTPVTDAAGIIEIINLLPGPRAARFRRAGAKVLVRVLGGDETLIAEIRENVERMEALASQAVESGVQHPMLQFKMPEGSNTTMAQRTTIFSPYMNGKTIGDFTGPCTYILLFTHEEKIAIKFGWSRNIKERMREHARTYPDMRIWCVLACASVEHAEETESLFKDKLAAFLFSVTLPPNQQTFTEVLLNVAPDMAEQKMRDAYETILQRHNHVNSRSDLEMKLEMKRLEVEMMRLEVERLKLEVELAHGPRVA
jgi:hypothetical protein